MYKHQHASILSHSSSAAAETLGICVSVGGQHEGAACVYNGLSEVEKQRSAKKRERKKEERKMKKKKEIIVVGGAPRGSFWGALM